VYKLLGLPDPSGESADAEPAKAAAASAKPEAAAAHPATDGTKPLA